MAGIKYDKLSNVINSIERYFQLLGKVHDLEYILSVYSIFSLIPIAFHTHFGHMSIVFLWVLSIIFILELSGQN